MNVADYATIVAARVSTSSPRNPRAAGADKKNAPNRRNEREAAPLRPTSQSAPDKKIDDETQRRDVPYRFWERRVEKPTAAALKEATSSPNAELGTRLDVFC